MRELLKHAHSPTQRGVVFRRSLAWCISRRYCEFVMVDRLQKYGFTQCRFLLEWPSREGPYNLSKSLFQMLYSRVADLSRASDTMRLTLWRWCGSSLSSR